MIKGEKIRLDIHNILFSIYKHNKTLNNPSIGKLISKQKKEDISFLHNVILNSMRYNLHCLKIIKKYIKGKIRDHEKILFVSAITQIVFLNFKEYAVINCSVEIAKKLKIYPGLLNASLKNIAKDKKKLKEIKINFNDFPSWFKQKTNSFSNFNKNHFINNFYKEPDLHIVFKDKKKFNAFSEGLIKTSDVSGFLINKKDIKNLKTFKNGDWWVQDFSSFLPLQNLKIENKKKRFLDACAAPGGKSFQLLSKNLKVTLNDKSLNRIKILKSNLTRLKYNAKILNKDFINFDEKEKYDFVIIDVPCSAIGTIRKNPEILFKNKGPNFKELGSLQKKMLEKASHLLEKNGLIIYMACSFFKEETVDKINDFLEKNNKFQQRDFVLKKENAKYSRLIKNNFMITLPDSILNKKIDGFFAILLEKIR